MKNHKFYKFEGNHTDYNSLITFAIEDGYRKVSEQQNLPDKVISLKKKEN